LTAAAPSSGEADSTTGKSSSACAGTSQSASALIAQLLGRSAARMLMAEKLSG